MHKVFVINLRNATIDKISGTRVIAHEGACLHCFNLYREQANQSNYLNLPCIKIDWLSKDLVMHINKQKRAERIKLIQHYFPGAYGKKYERYLKHKDNKRIKNNIIKKEANKNYCMGLPVWYIKLFNPWNYIYKLL